MNRPSATMPGEYAPPGLVPPTARLLICAYLSEDHSACQNAVLIAEPASRVLHCQRSTVKLYCQRCTGTFDQSATTARRYSPSSFRRRTSAREPSSVMLTAAAGVGLPRKIGTAAQRTPTSFSSTST